MKTPNILPLFWLHGEPFDILEQEIREMYKAGLRGFIAESRPFPGYMEEFWWETLEFILSLAEELGMQVMLFDDSHFPSGYADGIIAKNHPEHLRLLLEPVKEQFSHPGGVFHYDPEQYLTKGDREIAKVFLLKMNPDSSFRADSVRTLPCEKSEIDLPAGEYMLNLWKITRNGGEAHTVNYINFLSPEAVQCYIDTIYKPHVERLKRFVGKSFIGFFSDEPRLGNIDSYDAALGKLEMSLPYSPLLPLDQLPHLIMRSDVPEETRTARYCFMDKVSKLYSESFPRQIGRFCKEHGLIYIGHVIEDNGAHTRLGYGNGHFFRSMKGQSWAGVDTVLGQNRPGHTEGILSSVFGQYNSEFFHYSLMKLGSSCGALNGTPSFAEIFGAYGWSEDLAMMKWHTDHAIVRGINRLVPHAFSPKFPDPDCPPHFYARGKNAQWKYFPRWREYADLLCKIHSGGTAVSPAAVLYHAETEWQDSDCIKCEAVMKRLIRQQIDPVIVPLDMLENATVKNGVCTIENAAFKILFVSDFELLPSSGKDILLRLEKQGLRLHRITKENIDQLTAKSNCRECIDFSVEDITPALAVRHYKNEKTESYFLVNESPKSYVKTKILSDLSGFEWFDPLRKIRKNPSEILELFPGESLLLLRGELPEELHNAEWEEPFQSDGIVQNFSSKDFSVTCNGVPQDILPGKTFSGTALFRKTISFSDSQVQLRFPEINGNAVIELQINGMESRVRIAPPYHFQLDHLRTGSQLEVVFGFTTTPAPEFQEAVFDKDLPFPDDFWNWKLEIHKGNTEKKTSL